MQLRDLIKEKHDEAEHHRFAKYLFSGNITNEVYSDYLYNQYFIYNAIEERAEALGLLEGIEDIRRAHRIFNDYNELAVRPHICKYDITLDYISYVISLPADKLLAHIYVRHFGDMYGGAMIKKKVPGSGAMYEFENKKELIEKVRTKLTPEMADEANKVFDYAIRLFEELANEYDIQSIG